MIKGKSETLSTLVVETGEQLVCVDISPALPPPVGYLTFFR